MNTIPHALLLDIVRRLGHHGFRELDPLIAASQESRVLGLDDIVLYEVDIDEFIFVSPLYRLFLLRCMVARNTTASYVEGFRLAVQ